MITEFEEHSQGVSKVQFTVSRSSLPTLLEWSERLEAKFQVGIEIQWELGPDADRLGDASQVRWVSVSGDADNCKKAKNYISIFCDAPHRMNVNYPENVDAKLKESQVWLEETYSAVLQFVKVGQLLIKSSDEMSLTLVLSVIEEIVARFLSGKQSPQPYKPNWESLERHGEGSTTSVLQEHELETDSLEGFHDTCSKKRIPKLPVRNQPPPALCPTPPALQLPASLSTEDSKKLLGGGPLKLRLNQSRGIFAGQIIDLISDDSSSQSSSVSPDRKKLKSYSPEHQNHSPQPLPNLTVLDFGHNHLTAFKLTPKQEHAVLRILQKGDFSKSEVHKLLQKVGNNWQCCDLITLLHSQKNQDSVSTSALQHGIPPTAKLSKLKSTQESLIHNLRDNLPVQDDSGIMGRSLEMHFKQSPPDLSHQTSSRKESRATLESFAQSQQDVVKRPIKTEKGHGSLEMHFKQSPPLSHRTSSRKESQTTLDNFAQSQQDVIKKPIKTEKGHGYTWLPMVEGNYGTEESDSIIIIPSESEPEIVDGDSDNDSDAPEVFLIKRPSEVKPTKLPSRLPQDDFKHTAWSPSSLAAEGKQTKELRGVVESLQEQLKEMQAKIERGRAEASNEQQVVTLLQQTQQEEIQRQYAQQQEKLLEQQQHFQKQFEFQEKKLKAEQELALKQLRQQQQQQQHQQQQQQQHALATAATQLSPSEPIVIAPARKNPASPLRPVVIDGSNVAMSHGHRRFFSCRGIAICIQYFQKRGHQDITVFVPQGRRTQNPNSVDRPIREQKILDDLEKQGLLSFTPSRRIGHSYVTCYDDRFIVKLAVDNGGVIVSNDNYRDLMGVSQEWKHVVENRLVMYTFAGDRFMIPDDPMGRRGPTIEQLLRRPQTQSTDSKHTGHPLVSETSGLVPTASTLIGSSTLYNNYASSGLPVPISSRTAAATPSNMSNYRYMDAFPGLHGSSSATAATKTATAASTPYNYANPGLHVHVPSTKTTATATKTFAAATKTTAAAIDCVPLGAGSVAGSVPGSHVIRQNTEKSAPRARSEAHHSSSPKPLKRAPTPKMSRKGPLNDPTQHSCYDALITIFPDNEAEVQSVLSKFSSEKDANELVIHVLVEKEKMEVGNK